MAATLAGQLAQVLCCWLHFRPTYRVCSAVACLNCVHTALQAMHTAVCLVRGYQVHWVHAATARCQTLAANPFECDTANKEPAAHGSQCCACVSKLHAPGCWEQVHASKQPLHRVLCTNTGTPNIWPSGETYGFPALASSGQQARLPRKKCLLTVHGAVQAYADYNDLMELTEEMVASLVFEVKGSHK